MNKAYEYNPYSDNNNKKNSLIIEKDEITFYLLNNYTENILSSIQLSEKCLTSIFNTYKINSLLIFIASRKNEKSNTDKIKYEFYNPIPEKINQKINILKICQEEKKDLNLRNLEESSNPNIMIISKWMK